MKHKFKSSPQKLTNIRYSNSIINVCIMYDINEFVASLGNNVK